MSMDFNRRICGIAKQDVLVTSAETEDIRGETCNQFNASTTDTHVYVTLDECGKLIDNFNEPCGDKNKEMKVIPFLSLGCANYTLGHNEKSIACFENAVKLGKEMKDKEMERRAYTNLAVVLEVVTRQEKKSCHYREKALTDLIEADEGTDLKQRCALYNKQGILYHDIGKYDKSIRVHEKSLKLSEELGEKQGEGTSHYNLGIVYCTFGEYTKSIEHHANCLKIRTEMGDRHGQGISYIQLAYLCYMLSKYDQSNTYLQDALMVSKEIGAIEMEAICYNNLGCLSQATGEMEKAIQYHEQCIYLRKRTSQHPYGEQKTYKHLSGLFHAVGNHRMATGYQERSFSIDENAAEFVCSSSDCLQEELFETIEVIEGNENDLFLIPRKIRSYISKNVTKVTEYSSESIKKHKMLRQNHDDEYKLSLDDQSVLLYKTHASLSISFKNPNAALFALEQGRAPALIDLISKTYGSKTATNTTATGIHSNTLSSLIQKQKCSFLFMAFLMNNLFLWFVDKAGKLTLKQFSDPDPRIKNTKDLLETLSKETMETMKTEEEDNKIPNEEEERERKEKRDMCLRWLYKAIIAPVAGLIVNDEGPELIVIPEGQMFLIPFSALKDNNGNYLSDKVRIRQIPSLTTLKLIQDSPADYHCQNGALIVGVPNVGIKGFRPLKCARKEVEMISKLLRVPCLVGAQATKKEVLRRIQEVALVHIATHGSEERGEPALALGPSDSEEPVVLEDFVLTVEDVAGLKISAKLIVLSTCYSGRGKVMTGEGVVGIARAFLGSGARSVLVSLWQVRDEATSTFMYIFYKYLLANMSASEALSRTQNEMRSPKWGFDDEQDWASFTLIGDNVTLY